jgi:hypothetical protein
VRMLVSFENPVEPFNTMVRKGTAGPAIKKIMEAIKPEAVYFCANHGKRGGVMVVDLPDASCIPKIAEHLFLTFESTVEFVPCMTPEDLEKAGLENFKEK